jgi:predicted RNA methylase
VLDVACGNGSFAIALALAHPTIHVHGLDYAQGNIEKARDGANGPASRIACTFERVTVYDFDKHQTLHQSSCLDRPAGDVRWPLCRGVHRARRQLPRRDRRPRSGADDGAQVVYTCPRGNCAELVPRNMPLRRGHVHNFHHDDLKAVFGGKLDFAATYLALRPDRTRQPARATG